MNFSLSLSHSASRGNLIRLSCESICFDGGGGRKAASGNGCGLPASRSRVCSGGARSSEEQISIAASVRVGGTMSERASERASDQPKWTASENGSSEQDPSGITRRGSKYDSSSGWMFVLGEEPFSSDEQFRWIRLEMAQSGWIWRDLQGFGAVRRSPRTSEALEGSRRLSTDLDGSRRLSKDPRAAPELKRIVRSTRRNSDGHSRAAIRPLCSSGARSACRDRSRPDPSEAERMTLVDILKSPL